MLTDPLTVPSSAAVEQERNLIIAPSPNVVGELYRLLDLTPQGSKRKWTDGNNVKVMSIDHSTSKENTPYITDRTRVRLDHIVNDENGKPVTTSAFILVAQPRQAGGVTFGNGLALAYQLAGIVLFGELTPTSGGNGTMSFPNSEAFPRILYGEP